MKIDLTTEELRIIDNELYVAQCKLAHLNYLTADQMPPSEEQLHYKEIVNKLRVKFGKFLKRETVKVAMNE